MIDQAIIATFGIAAVTTSQSARPQIRRWACIAGLVAQPAWMYATASAGQWGMFVLTLVYTAAWARGFWNFWILKAGA